MRGCGEELCLNWSGDGRVCPCALFDLDPQMETVGCCIEQISDREWWCSAHRRGAEECGGVPA